MRALVISDGALELVERDTPRPAADQVLVEVAGAGVNRADLLQRKGRHPAPRGWPADVPGLEFAGRVAAVGPTATSLAPSDAVCGIAGGGAQASHVLVPEALCAPVPETLDLVAAGGVPEAFVTAHDALVQAGLRPGERVLIHAVGSGVGTAAVQLAAAMGAQTVGTSRTAEKLERAADLGLDEGVLAGEDMARRIGEVDLVLDLVGGDYLEVDLQVCREKGRIVVVGLMAGGRAGLDLGRLLRRRLTIMGTVLRARPNHEKAAAMQGFRDEVLPLFERGVIRPVVERILALERAEEAYALLASNSAFGKIVLAPRLRQ